MEIILQLGELFGSGDGEFYNPYDIAIDAADNVIVTDALNHRVQKFDNNGVYITAWGSLESGQGQFEKPEGIFVDVNDYVYAADDKNNRIQKFDSNVNFITQWGTWEKKMANLMTLEGLLSIRVDICMFRKEII